MEKYESRYVFIGSTDYYNAEETNYGIWGVS